MQAGQAADDGLIEVVDDDALTAWDNYRRAKEGRTFPRNAARRLALPSKYPPGFEPRKGEASPPVIPQLPRASNDHEHPLGDRRIYLEQATGGNIKVAVEHRQLAEAARTHARAASEGGQRLFALPWG